MTARLKKFALLLFFFSLLGMVLLAGVFFSFSRWAKAPQSFEAPLIALIEERLGTHLSFQEAKVVFTPFPALQLQKLRLDSPNEQVTGLAAEEVRFALRFLPLLFGRAVPSGLWVRGGEEIGRASCRERVCQYV